MTTALTPAEAIAQAAVTAWDQECYVEATRNAVVREAVDLLVGGRVGMDDLDELLAVQGDVQLACWSLHAESKRLATVSGSAVSVADALLAYHRSLADHQAGDVDAIIARVRGADDGGAA